MDRYICIHGHFYQPPRENPWLEEVELQESAYPYHDWNERITVECYATNQSSRILNPHNRIIDIVNNYAKISFNFGPTLLSWMERHATEVYQAIIKADEEAQKRFSGHGSSLAQPYNHMIMPLANTRDAWTQVLWGIQDFEYRFHRKPEGMWLPETAVNVASLEILAACGIKFTILAPHQAKQIRKIGEKNWQDVTGSQIDPHQVYLCPLPSGRSIHLFFYDGPVSRDTAFGDLLKNGEKFAQRLLNTYAADAPTETSKAQLVHIASDGETYGHHQRFGEMALSFCLYYIESKKLANLTIYGEFLEKYPPTHEVEIIENTSWSCAHGVERWRSNCGCHLGTKPGWQQTWRTPLRNALDWLRDSLIPVYEAEMRIFTDDPWKIRDHYIEVVLDRSPGRGDQFFKTYFSKEIQSEERIKILKLLEMERHGLLMYTSCGWFFDEISGIETTQILRYAARAMQLAKEVYGTDLEGEFVKRLEAAPSNIPDYKNGAIVYERLVKPAIVDLLRVGAHYAVSSLFKEYPPEAGIYCYTVYRQFADQLEAGRHRIVFGRARIRSWITGEENRISYAALHMGDHNLKGGVRFHMEDEAYLIMQQEIRGAFLKGDIPEVIHRMNVHFGSNNFSLWHLFKHEQKLVFDQILESTLSDIEAHFRQIYEQNYPLMLARKDLNIPLPKALAVTVEFINNRELLDILERGDLDLERLKKVTVEIKRWGFEIDKATVGFVAIRRINEMMQKMLASTDNQSLLTMTCELLNMLGLFQLDLNLWQAQNIYFTLSRRQYKNMCTKDPAIHPEASPWIRAFRSLGDLLKVKCD